MGTARAREPVELLRVASAELDGLADLLRQDRDATGAVVGTVVSTLLDPAVAASLVCAPVTHVEATGRLLAAQALAVAHELRAGEEWLLAAHAALAYQAADTALAALLATTAPGPGAWRALLRQLQLGAGTVGAGLGWETARRTAAGVLAAAGVPMAPRLPPATEPPPHWGAREARMAGFDAELEEALQGTEGSLAALRRDDEGRVVPLDLASLLVSGAQAARLGGSDSGGVDGAVIRVVRYPGDPPGFVAILPGSAGWGFGSPTDWLYNLTAGRPLQAAARDALGRAIAAAELPPEVRPVVGVAGFSQGGIAALGLGASLGGGGGDENGEETGDGLSGPGKRLGGATASGAGAGFDLAFVAAAGAPDLQRAVVPEGVRVLAFEDPDDPVPYLDGREDPAGWELREVDAGGPGTGAHDELRYARAVAARLTPAEDPVAALAARGDGPPTVADYYYEMP